MVSNGGILNCSENGRGDGHNHIYIRDTRYVYIGTMSVIDCQSYFLRVNKVVIGGGSFNAVRDGTHSAITLSNVSHAIIRERSCSNYSHGLSGGCLNLSTSTLLVFDSILSSNRARTGGVVNMEGTNPSTTVERCSFRNNSGVHDGGVFHAGAISLLAINNSTFSDNSVPHRGGVVCHLGGSGRFMVSGSNFTDNSAGIGGVMYSIRGGPFTFVDENFISNSAGSGGAVYLSHCWSSTTVTNTLFINNVAAHRCGVLFLDHN